MKRILKKLRKNFALDGDFRFQFILAKDLGKTVNEIRQMGTVEFYQWMAFYSYQEKMRKAEENKAKSKRR